MSHKDYWIGPYDIKVPSSIDSIIDIDECSLIKKNGR